MLQDNFSQLFLQVWYRGGKRSIYTLRSRSTRQCCTLSPSSWWLKWNERSSVFSWACKEESGNTCSSRRHCGVWGPVLDGTNTLNKMANPEQWKKSMMGLHRVNGRRYSSSLMEDQVGKEKGQTPVCIVGVCVCWVCVNANGWQDSYWNCPLTLVYFTVHIKININYFSCLAVKPEMYKKFMFYWFLF